MSSSLEDIRAHNERVKKDREAQETYMKKQEGFGLKYDTDKLRWDLLDLKLIKEIVKVYSFGAKKYTDNSWQQVENAKERYYAAMMRHLEAYRAGEKKDPESGLLHTSHIGWNAVALIHFDLTDSSNLVDAPMMQCPLCGKTLSSYKEDRKNHVCYPDIQEDK